MDLTVCFNRFDDYQKACDWCHFRWKYNGTVWKWIHTVNGYGIEFSAVEYKTEFLLSYNSNDRN